VKHYAILLLFLSIATAQQKKVKAPDPAATEKPNEPITFPLETLKVVGNKRLTAEKIIAVSGLKIGAPVVKADFDAARARLLATGAFESVAYEFNPSATYQGEDGVLDVAEVDQLYPYRFEELPTADDVLRTALRQQELILGDQIPATHEVIDRYVKVIQALTGPAVTVTGMLSNDLPGRMMVLFRPNTPREQIAEVRFIGNDVLPRALLNKTLAEVAVGTAYTEATMRVLLDSNIRPLYDARGRIRVSFPAIEPKPAGLIDGTVVTITVNEGPSYSLGTVKFAGVPQEEAQKIANIQAHDIANFDEVNAGLDRVLQHDRNLGYLHATGRTDREIDDQAHRVGVTLTVDRGPQFTMGKLEIAGLDINTEPAIRKAWSLQPGAPFQPGYPDAFLNDLRTQGVFDNLGKTRAETNINEKSHTVDVKLFFAAAAPAEPKERRKKGPRDSLGN
jgi:outer membrane protein insertion porin family